jgi:hypothetical protein
MQNGGVGRLDYTLKQKNTARVRTLLVSVPFLLLALGQRVGGVALDASIDRHHRRVDAAIEVLRPFLHCHLSDGISVSFGQAARSVSVDLLIATARSRMAA